MTASLGAAERADRAVKAYAYLTASFRAANDVNDVLDCIVPFVATVTLRDRSLPVNVAEVTDSLERFGLRIPRYAVQQLLPRLQRRGLLEWSAVAKAYIPVQKSVQAETSELALADDFSALEQKIAVFAQSLELGSVPFSLSWSEALIKFLQSENLRSGMKSVLLKKAIISEHSEVENFIIARFLQYSYATDRSTFDSIARVYSGVLIEDFVNNVQSIGNARDYKGLNVFYDTSVMLRLLGCSGRELETATLEMHNSLVELGCDLYYFEINRTEVDNILQSIINANSYGHEIFGETGEAILDGEISIAAIRDLSATFETRLGQLNVFPFEYDYGTRKADNVFQINELDFTDALVSAAMKSDRSYKRENALNDARAVALVLRLRRGKASTALSSARFIFVSQNSLLQRTARKFCVEHLQEYDESNIFPVITVGQITTAGWLATERALQPHKVSKELLGNCYSAVRPSAAWADEFAKALEQFSAEDKEILSERADAALILKGTREAVRDQSLNEAAVLRKINVAEIFRATTARADFTERERAAEISRLQEQHKEELESSLIQLETEQAVLRDAAVEEAAQQAAKAAAEEHVVSRSERNQERANKIASRLVLALTVCLVLLLGCLAIADRWNPFQPASIAHQATGYLAAGLAIIGILDLCDFRPVGRVLDRVRRWLADRIFDFLQDEQLL